MKPEHYSLGIIQTLPAFIFATIAPLYATEQIISIEGSFGKVAIDTNAPSLVGLHLTGPSGPTTQPTLAQSGAHSWVKGAYTYIIDNDGKRYESRLTKPDKVEDGHDLIRLTGVKICAASDREPIAVEDWTLSAPGDGEQLNWHIKREWKKDVTVSLSGSPGLFFSFDLRRTPQAVTNTIWYDPMRMIARFSPLYALYQYPGKVSPNHLQTIRDRDTWAIYKLWTNWHAPSDLWLGVEGGHLYRRGSYGEISEAGAVTHPDATRNYSKGQTEQITLKIKSVDKTTTGYQLAITLPDKTTEASLKDFYTSVLNGGAINDQKGYDFGNETDGYYYAGSCWMYGMTLAAGTPANGKLSAHPYDAVHAFREHLAHIFSTLDDKGRAHFGYNQSGEWVDDNLHTIIGTRAYLLHSGDLAFVRQNLPALERMLGYFIKRRNDQGLFALESSGAHWYYDCMKTSGVNSYYNAFFYKAACDLAEMEEAAGHATKAQEYATLAESIKSAFNKILWRENLPGGPRYVDWIDSQGEDIAYFCDLCQWPAVAVGIASPEQARKIVATADARMKQLEKEYGYQGYAGLSALWPVPDKINMPWQTFGLYMNGGSLLSQTYWEIMGRAKAGDSAGAWRRLRLFAERANQTSWAGDNSATIKAEMPWKPYDDEPYLADMVVVTASAVQGILGITPTWNKLEVKPCLPADWLGAEAEIIYKGQRHRVTIADKKVQVTPLEQVMKMPLLWVVDANWRTAPGGARATSSDVDFGDGSSIALKRVYHDQGALALWKLDDEAGQVSDASPHTNYGSIKGGVDRAQPGHHESSKCFRFNGSGYVSVPDDGTLTFGKAKSFTIQCWFKADAGDNRVLLAKPEAYGVSIKNDKLAAWIWESPRSFKEALGTRPVADGKWHHVAAVFNRETKQLSLFLDGQLDTADGSAGADISLVGESTSRADVTLGSLGASNMFKGSIDEISISRGALKQSEFSFEQDYKSPTGSAKVSHATSGTYLSPPFDWSIPAKLKDLTIAADLNGGRVNVQVETSNDDFKTIDAQTDFTISDGFNTYSLSSLPNPARTVRVRFNLTASNSATTTPTVDAFRITALPVEE